MNTQHLDDTTDDAPELAELYRQLEAERATVTELRKALHITLYRPSTTGAEYCNDCGYERKRGHAPDCTAGPIMDGYVTARTMAELVRAEGYAAGQQAEQERCINIIDEYREQQAKRRCTWDWTVQISASDRLKAADSIAAAIRTAEEGSG